MAKGATAKGHAGRGQSVDTSRRLLALAVLALLLVALASNVYLAQLYLRVSAAPGQTVDSFCNVTEAVNCANVAASRYATFLGVPVAVYGAEFYGLTALVLLLSLARVWRLRSWESLLFWAMILALPFSAIMAYISAFVIRMLCPLCAVVYGINLVVLLLLIVTGRGDLGGLVRSGPRELRAALSSSSMRAALVFVLAAGVSQLFWVPPLMGQRPAKSKLPGAQTSTASHPPGGRVVGNASAPVQILEFSDFQCSICSHAHEVMVKVLVQAHDRVYFRHLDYPLDSACNREVTRAFHGDACRAAYYARCADEQQKFWPFSALVFENQHNLSRDKLRSLAQEVGLDAERLEQCVSAPRTRHGVLNEIEEGIRHGVRGTPTFLINGEKVVGPRDVQFWLDKIDALSAGGARVSKQD